MPPLIAAAIPFVAHACRERDAAAVAAATITTGTTTTTTGGAGCGGETV